MKKIKGELKERRVTFCHLVDVVAFLQKNGFLKGFQLKELFNDIVCDECDNYSFTKISLDKIIKNLDDESSDHVKYLEMNKTQINALIRTFQFLKDYFKKSEIEVYVRW